MYFVISSDEDGGSIRQMDKQQLLEFLSESQGKYYKSLPLTLGEFSQLNYWGEDQTLIIKGEIIVPKPVEIVTTYDVD